MCCSLASNIPWHYGCSMHTQFSVPVGLGRAAWEEMGVLSSYCHTQIHVFTFLRYYASVWVICCRQMYNHKVRNCRSLPTNVPFYYLFKICYCTFQLFRGQQLDPCGIGQHFRVVFLLSLVSSRQWTLKYFSVRTLLVLNVFKIQICIIVIFVLIYII